MDDHTPRLDDDSTPNGAIAHSTDDRGFSLVEILISIALMAMVVGGLLAAVQVSLKASATNERVARAESALTAAATLIDRAEHSCTDLSAAVSAAAVAAYRATGTPPQVTLLSEHYSIVGGAKWVLGTCPDAATSAAGVVQRFTVTLFEPDSGLTRDLQVVR